MKPEQYYIDECDPRVVEYIHQLESERQEIIDALTLAHNHIEFCRDAGMKPSRDVSSQIKTALRNAGVTEG